MFKANILETIGKTSIVKLNKINPPHIGKILAKIEYKNPLGSVKDRPALFMINQAESAGLLKKGGHIIEPTSGNTGIGLAMIAAVKSYKITLTMPESMSIERRKLLTHLGANLVLTPVAEGMKGAINKAKELAAADPLAFMPNQFENPSNVEAHRLTTAEEIWADLNGEVDVFIAGVGTGGTISGVARALKPKKPHIKIIAVEPEESPVISGGKPGSHKIQGIGAGFIPPILALDLIDEVIQINSADAIATAKRLAKEEGILAGISSGAAVAAALKVAARPEFKNKNIVTILPSTGERYLSTALFD